MEILRQFNCRCCWLHRRSNRTAALAVNTNREPFRDSEIVIGWCHFVCKWRKLTSHARLFCRQKRPAKVPFDGHRTITVTAKIDIEWSNWRKCDSRWVAIGMRRHLTSLLSFPETFHSARLISIRFQFNLAAMMRSLCGIMWLQPSSRSGRYNFCICKSGCMGERALHLVEAPEAASFC